MIEEWVWIVNLDSKCRPGLSKGQKLVRDCKVKQTFDSLKTFKRLCKVLISYISSLVSVYPYGRQAWRVFYLLQHKVNFHSVTELCRG